MRVQLLALVTLLSAFAVAQEVAPTLKGHRLGETIPEYFSMSTDADAGFVLNCLAGGKLPRLASESGVLSKKEQKKRAAGYCADIHAAVEHGKRLIFAAEDSITLDPSEVGTARAFVSPGFNGAAIFEDGKLVQLDLALGLNQPFSQIAADVDARARVPRRESETGYQNLFGATIQCRSAFWTGSDFMFTLTETPARDRVLSWDDRDLRVVLASTADLQKQAERQQKHPAPSPLN